MSTYKQSFIILWGTKSCCLWMSKEVWTTCNTCHHCYQPTTRGVEKLACSISIGTMRLNLDASCNENGLNLSLDPTPCFLVPIIVKCSKLVIMEAQALLDFDASTCFMDNELMWQYNLPLMEKNTPVLVEVINGWNLLSRLIIHETKPLDVAINSHTSRVVFNVISFLRNLVIIGLFWLVLQIHEWICIWIVFTLKHHNTSPRNVESTLEACKIWSRRKT
jgi:hypothetical protein